MARNTHNTLSYNSIHRHNFWRERRAEVDSNRGPSAYQPNTLPLGQTGSHYSEWVTVAFYSLLHLLPVTQEEGWPGKSEANTKNV